MMTVDGLPPLLSATMLLGVTCKEGLCTLSELAAQTVQLELLATINTLPYAQTVQLELLA